MHKPPGDTSWKITCYSPADAKAIQQWLASRIDPDRVMPDTVRTTPNGVEHVQTVQHRLGDYFAAIRILPDSEESPAIFRLVFQKRANAGRFWKDLMVNILQEIESTSRKTSIEKDSKVNRGPETMSEVD